MSSSDDDPPTEQDARRPPPKSSSPVHSPAKRPMVVSNMDRAKGAFTLMGLTFAPADDAAIKTAQVVYKKRNIRSHNRALRFNPPPRDHSSNRQMLVDKVKKFLDESEVGSFSAEEDNMPPPIDHDLFSEKDDSDSDRYYSAEESTPLRERQQKRKRLRRRKTPSSLPKEIADDLGLVKYWCQRYRLFSKFDQGIRLDSESWYSVTPEKVAAHIAERCRCDTIIDAFCGAGGNAIQFTLTCERVIAIDIDPSKIELAKHNAKIYGVDDRIEFIIGDFFSLAPNLKGDVVFLSPPWGGPDYSSQNTYSIDRLLPNGGSYLYNVAKQISPHLSIYLPKNVNTSELIELAGPGGFVEVEQNFLDKKLVAVSAYYGELVDSPDVSS